MVHELNDFLELVPCPVCCSQDLKTVLRISPNEFLGKRKEYYDLSAIGISLSTLFSIKKCKKCTFVFTNPRLKPAFHEAAYNEAKAGQIETKPWAQDGSDLAHLYNTFHKWRKTQQLMTSLGHFKERFEKAKNVGHEKIKILDYGCGYGHILELCRVFGIEADGVEIDQGRINHCLEKGLSVTRPESLGNKKYDVAISTSVIEHVNDLNEYFSYISCRLTKGGVFLLDGLTDRMIEIEVKKEKFKNVHPIEHLNYFTRKSFDIIAQRHGFRRVRFPIRTHVISNLKNFVEAFARIILFRGFYPGGHFEAQLRKVMA